MNEPLVFGLPVILNPILFPPFLAVPVVSLLIAYLATACGFMPVVTSASHGPRRLRSAAWRLP